MSAANEHGLGLGGPDPRDLAHLSDRHRRALDRAWALFHDHFLPRAEAVDQAPGPPLENLRLLAGAGLLGLAVPEAFGGLAAPAVLMREFAEGIASACGVTAFTQGQHHAAAGLISGGVNDGLKERLLPRLASGELPAGVGFSHLRRPGPPVCRAVEEGSGFVVDGEAPWVTGWGAIRGAVLGATLPDDRLLFFWADLDPGDPGRADLCASLPLPLAAMNATGTVRLTLRGLRVGPVQVVKVIPRAEMQRSDVAGVPGGVSFPLGCARGSLRLLKEKAPEAAAVLEQEIAAARGKAYALADRPAPDQAGWAEEALSARVRAIELAVRAAHLAVAACGGSANSLSHPAQRLMREATFYTLTAQTAAVRAATIARLAAALREERSHE